jgi:glycerophosphoryl diester phosphodiesterase
MHFFQKLLLFFFLSATACTSDQNHNNMSTKTSEQSTTIKIDWQGHRGARGLLPENTIPSFIKALEYDIKTLELDVVVSKDKQIIVSHEPWFSEHICTKPNGEPVTEAEAKSLNIYQLTYEEIKTYDCGMRGNVRFEEQQPMKVFKPSFMEMVSNVELYCKQNNRTLPYYNVEIKTEPEYYDVYTPAPEEFVRLMLKEIALLNLHDRVNLQSFDFNILREVKKQDPTISMAMLIENLNTVQDNLDELGFTPPIYSPYYMLLNEEVIKEIHTKGMRIIPWTVNDPVEMKKLADLGIDGIITDYPNRIPK